MIRDLGEYVRKKKKFVRTHLTSFYKDFVVTTVVRRVLNPTEEGTPIDEDVSTTSPS